MRLFRQRFRIYHRGDKKRLNSGFVPVGEKFKSARVATEPPGYAAYSAEGSPTHYREPSEALQTKTNRLKEKIETLKQQMQRLERLKVEMLATPDQQISLTDPDARSMATSGRGSGVVGYNVQIAVEANHHLIVMHEVTNEGTDRSQFSHVANETKAALGVEKLDAVADRGYFNSEEILACEEAGITVTLPKPMTSNAKGRRTLRQAGLPLCG